MNTQALWHDFLAVVREEVGSRVVETWFKAVTLVRWDVHAKIAYLEAPNRFVTDWLTAHYSQLMREQLGRLLNERELNIVFMQPTETAALAVIKTALPHKKEEALFEPAVPLAPAAMPAVIKGGKPRGSINTQYTFETFVVGPTNTLAFAAAKAVAEKPGRLYNPLFMYGASGLGKTHLLHAIGNYIQARDPKLTILYQAADRFVHEFINAIRFDRVYQFEARYKDVDVLLVDDIQSISNKEQTQEAFFHIFNALHQAHKQVVCTSDSMPRSIAGLAERMRSRLEGGLIADIQAPTLETKIAILRKKAEAHRMVIADEVAQYIAHQVHSNVRELEGALIRVCAYASLTNQPVTLELAQRVVLPSVIAQQTSEADLALIAGVVAEHFKCSVAALRSSNRHKDIAHARHVAMYLMKKNTARSLRDIALFFARKDHTTVMYGCEKIEEALHSDPVLKYLVQTLDQRVARGAG